MKLAEQFAKSRIQFVAVKSLGFFFNFGYFFVCAPGQISGAIEVEQKFLFGPSTIEKLAELGAILEGRVSFRDSYYDVPDWCLTREDHWLREREGVGWELKCPPDVGVVGSKETPCAAETDNHPSAPVLRPPRDTRSSHAATPYREVTSPQNIVTRLCGLLDRVPGQNWTCVNKAVEELGLEVFASFVTTRHKYRTGDLHVDLDEVDFGYAVGEVEAMVRQLEDVPEALEKIQKFCRQLGKADLLQSCVFVYERVIKFNFFKKNDWTSSS